MRGRTAAVVLAAALAACGKKGPPLAPIVLVPARPDGFAAARQGDAVRLEFVVPAANTDGSRPAAVERVDIYGFTGLPNVTDEDLLRLGRRIASVEVNEPPDPDRPAPDQAAPPARGGVDQGSTVRLVEVLTAELKTPAEVPAPRPPPAAAPGSRESPAATSPAMPSDPMRVYLAVGVSGGRTGPASRRASVPLVEAPRTPAAPEVTYTEQAIEVRWSPAADLTGYHVYELAREEEPAGPRETRLNKAPVTEGLFADARVEWGATRCYTIRAVAIANSVPIESDAPSPSCVTLKDTFAPPPPSTLTAVASAGAVSLIWDAAPAPDLAGYLVLKGAPGGPLASVTPAPVPETTFRDAVPPGTRVAYAVQAVDKAGNVSAPSATVEETAR
jgi:hypothetical protein